MLFIFTSSFAILKTKPHLKMAKHAVRLRNVFMSVFNGLISGLYKYLLRPTLLLFQAMTAFFVLVYIHIAFSRTPTTCLEHVRDSWPRDGILRVEILRGESQSKDFTMEEAYTKNDKTDFTSIFGGGLGRDG